ncbi:unnamed protein product [Hermetia illucens]|uniref:Uncharacterized protein n=1 Tax=Hermetia illucens TaxID=343691 RepID=A0A7R8UI56_HERIL|nr:unnamed protein product [Hermetia illucens]
MLRACAVLNTQWEVLPTMLGTETGLSKTSFQRGYKGMSGGFPFVQKDTSEKLCALLKGALTLDNVVIYKNFLMKSG